MTRRLLDILNDYDKAYELFTNDDINDQSVYEDMLSRVVSTRDLLKVNRAYYRYIELYKQRGQTEDIYRIFRRSINSMMYRDTSTGLVVPLFEIMYLLKIGYTIETVIRTVATFPDTVQPIISDKKCESVCLSLLYPTRRTNVNLNAIHIEPDIWNMSDNLDMDKLETFINPEETIISRGTGARTTVPRESTVPREATVRYFDPSLPSTTEHTGLASTTRGEITPARTTVQDISADPFAIVF